MWGGVVGGWAGGSTATLLAPGLSKADLGGGFHLAVVVVHDGLNLRNPILCSSMDRNLCFTYIDGKQLITMA